MLDDLAGELLTSERFRVSYARAATARVARDLLGQVDVGDDDGVNWSFLLSCASVLSLAKRDDALDAALRIMQTSLAAPGAAEEHKHAATMLLDRLGNRPALELARARRLIGDDDLAWYPAPIRLDIVRNRLELVVPQSDGPNLHVSRFQRDLWNALQKYAWVSASAPTSAGKSRIIRRWFGELVARDVAASAGVRRLVAIVPTRALVDEVARALAAETPQSIPVHTVPWDARAGSGETEIYVLTQERFHLLQQRFRQMTWHFIFVDEAHKFGDGARGVLLHQVVDEAVRRSPNTQIVFASPLAEDPEVLLDAAPEDVATAVVDSQSVTVTQNLIYVNEVTGSRQEWRAELVLADGLHELGKFELPARATGLSKRLPLVAAALGRRAGGNLVYADGAAAAEAMADLIYDALGTEADVSSDPDVAALIDLVRRTVSPRYKLANVIARGVAFHYGNMPQLVRGAIEDLFRKEKIQFLVCTSTLLEGVNLPCRSLFVRGPHRGKNKPMSAADFWNLAGRAGRWGMEFEGNVLCVDTADRSRWPMLPERRVRQRLRRETAAVLSTPDQLLGYIAAGTPVAPPQRELEAVYSFLASRVSAGVSLRDLPGLALPPTRLQEVADAVAQSLAGVELPEPLLTRHAGLSPIAMQRLLDAMRQQAPEALLLSLPEQRGAWESYSKAFALLVETMGADFGVDKRRRQLAVLVVRWMTGQPLVELIGNRLQYQATLPKPESVAKTIRSVMDDVESVARFLAPKYLSCYVDVLRYHLAQSGRDDLLTAMPSEIDMLLELGVATTTEVSLLSLGLSRTSAVELFRHIVNDAMSPAECLAWIHGNDLGRLDLPVLVRSEIEQAVSSSGVGGHGIAGDAS